MAGKARTETVETVTLVSPDGEITRKDIAVGSKEDVGLRWDGYLPQEQQKLEAPKVEAPQTPKTVGSNA